VAFSLLQKLSEITDTNISKYIKPEMAVHMKPVILLSYPVWEDIN
jgi:hypothetical protein